MLHRFSDLTAFRRDPLTFFLNRGSEAKHALVPLHVGLHPVLLVTDPDLVRHILRAEEEAIYKGRLIFKMREVIGRSSLTISGEQHRIRRATIHKQLAAGLAGDYVPEIASTIREFAALMAREEVIEAPRTTAFLALRVICTILFGRGAMSKGDENAIVTAIHLVEDDLAEEIFRALPHTPWSYTRKKRKLRQARAIMSVVVERMRKNAKKQSLLRAFEELGLQGVDLRDEVLLMLLAGHHTTGTAATWLLYHLATQPELASELATEAEALSDDAGELTPHAMKRAHVSKGFVHEILRLYPSTYWMSRETKRPIELAGIKLSAGTSLIMSPWHLHRDPRFWDIPEEFNTNRDYSSKAYMPFGYGARACVGMMVSTIELQIMALEFAAAFHLRVVSKVPADPPKPSVTLVPSDVRLIFQPRHASRKKPNAA